MDTFISFQPASFVDHVAEDGYESRVTPFPLSFFLDGKIVDEDDFWRGHHDVLLGFQKDLDVQHVDIRFAELAEKLKTDPKAFDKTVGMYMVVVDRWGDFGVLTNAVSSVTVYETQRVA